MKIFDTENSTYELDDENHRYRRSPREREQHVESDRLTYGDWHPLKSWEIVIITASPFQAPELGVRCLHIMHETSVEGIYTSPIVAERES